MKFAHMGDCHLGGWRQPELNELNFLSFKKAVERTIKEKVDFVLIAGDLLDSAYPSIDTLKDAFSEFRKWKDANIPVFIIAGSHDYSVSGKTFLDVLEKAGFCKNVYDAEEINGQIYLKPVLFKNVAIYGYPGKKSGLEVDEINRIKIHDSPGLFKILMLHTAIRDAIGELPIKAVDHRFLPEVNYLALAHLHINYNKLNRVYSGPTFPNNLPEIEELKHGFFHIFDNGKIRKEELRIKEVEIIDVKIDDSYTAYEKINDAVSKCTLKDKVVILKISGLLQKGKISDIDFAKIEADIKSKGAYVVLKTTSKLEIYEPEINVDEITSSPDLEQDIIDKFAEKNPSEFNEHIFGLMRALQAEKLEDEKSTIYEERVFSEVKKVLSI
jgi:DNA repair protein SbcD/Mre11